MEEIDFSEYLTNKGRLKLTFKTSDLYEKLKKMYPWCNPNGVDLKFCYDNNIVNQPVCPVCGGDMTFPRKKTCGTKCARIVSVKAAVAARNGSAWNKGLDMKALGYKHAKESNPIAWEDAKRKISYANSGDKNGMYGHVASDEYRKKCSDSTIRTILDGKFTPKSNNRLTHFNCAYDGKVFRSSWEAAFWSIHKNTVEFESLRIPYYHRERNKTRVYIIDFVDHKNKVVYEVRPSSLFDESSDKIRSAFDWCSLNGYKYQHIDIDYLYNNKHLIDYQNMSTNTVRKIEHAFKIEERNRKARNCI